MVNMNNESKEYMIYLENRTYRSLQQLAKSMDLPSNYKKVYLIELIYARKFRSEDIVKTIIQKVKIERLLLSKNKNKNKKKQIKKALKSNSPSITTTPKCPKLYLPFSPEVQRAIIKHNSRRSLLNDIERHMVTPKPSDRVLRSFNVRQISSPSYEITNINDALSNIQHNMNSKTISKVNTQTGNLHKYYVKAECVMKKHRPAILNTSCISEPRKPIILRQKDVIQNSYVAARGQRTVSGIYPLVVYKNFPQNVHTTENVVMRKNDGSLTKINALIQKCNANNKQRVTYCNTEINIQDIIDSIEDNNENINNDLPEYQAIESRETIPLQSVLNPQMENNNTCNERDAYSIYHLNKMRQQRRYEGFTEHPSDKQNLPKIDEVFSKFNNMKEISQPLYVQVSTESELSQNYPYYANSNCNTVLLESLYNFKSQMLTNVPLLQIATTANTKCIFSTTTKTTARAHQSASHGTDAFSYNSYEQENRYLIDKDPRLCDFFRYSEQQMQQHTDMSWQRPSSSDTFPERSTPATIPEMLEDAVELISQDGDYMEQIGMDVRVSCALCSWAGPNIIHENHILKEHGAAVVEARGGEWRVSWSLGALAGGARAHVLRHSAALYVLRARYRDPERLAADLASISADPAPKLGVITVYNKVSGEPYTWRGYIQPLTDRDDTTGLKVDISQLDLLPNSANLKLLNRELVSDSLNKVIVGAPVLNDINIVMYVKIF